MGSCQQIDEPQLSLEVFIRVAHPPLAGNLVFLAQPPAEPLGGMGVDRPIGRTDWTEPKVIRLADQFPVQPSHDKLGIQSGSAAVGFLGHAFHHPLDALLRGSSADVGAPGRTVVALPEDVTQEVKPLLPRPALPALPGRRIAPVAGRLRNLTASARTAGANSKRCRFGRVMRQGWGCLIGIALRT